jgi:hypothetical protein
MRPPGVDQTGRSAQQWQVVAPGIKQVHRLGKRNAPNYEGVGVPIALFNETPLWDVWSLFARPVVGTKPQAAANHVLLRGPRSTPCAFQKLSNELLDMIIDSLEPEKSDLIALGLTSTFFWELILNRIQSGYVKATATWANTPIAFQGNYATDLPNGFMENGLAYTISPERARPVMAARRRMYGNGMCQARRFYWAHKQFPHAVDAKEEARVWNEAAQAHRENCQIPESNWLTMMDEISCQEFFPQDRTWVLRNLTKRETVSSDSLNGPLPRKAKAVTALTFEDLLLMKICWTEKNNCRYEKDLGIDQGTWAGDKFDIVTMEVHQKETEVNDWIDVSEEIVKEAEELKAKVLPMKKAFSTFWGVYGRDED